MQLITTTGSDSAANAVIRLNPLDDVLIARQPLPKGLHLQAEHIEVLQAIPAGHKVAVRAIAPGQPLRRYGQIIGFASQPIAAGEHVHVHNLAMGDFARDYAFGVDARGTPATTDDTFMGIPVDARRPKRTPVVKLNKPHTLLSKPTCQETIAPKASGFRLVQPIHRLDMRRLRLNINRLRDTHLHPGRELIRFYPCCDA